MADLKETRKRLVIAYGALAAVAVVAIVLLFSPWAGSAKERGEEQQQLRAESRRSAI